MTTPDLPQRLVAVGQLTWDTTVQLACPLALGDQSTGERRRSFGGTAAIVAHNAARLELAPVTFVGHVGDDFAGRAGVTDLRAAGVIIGQLLRTPDSREVMVLVDPDGERTMIASGSEPDWDALRLTSSDRELLFFEGWHLFGRDRESYGRVIADARAAGATVAIDVCSAARAGDPAEHARLLRSLSPEILLANDLEATVFGLEPWDDPGVLVVHSGSRPTRVWTAGEMQTYDVTPRRALDTTGAGDSFAAGLLSSIAAGHPLRNAVELAHRVAGEVVVTPGPLLLSQIGGSCGNRA